MWEPVAAALGHFSGQCFFAGVATERSPVSVQAEYLRLQVLMLVKFGVLNLEPWSSECGSQWRQGLAMILVGSAIIAAEVQECSFVPAR